jgi:hypothetical protein
MMFAQAVDIQSHLVRQFDLFYNLPHALGGADRQ